MMTLRKVPLALAVASAVLSTQALAVDFHGYARSAAVNSSVSKRRELKVNTVWVTNVKLMRN